MTDRHGLASIDARLGRLREAWISLSKPVVLAILDLGGSPGVVTVEPASDRYPDLRNLSILLFAIA